jgi:hypothetical protein
MEEGGVCFGRLASLNSVGWLCLCFVWSGVVELCDFVMKVMKSGLCPLMKKKKKNTVR